MEILIISGLSGGGKSKAASFLEDMGFYIVDNMPAAMILKFAEFCAGGGGRYDRVALVYDVRTATSFTELFDVLDQLKTMECECRMLFLEASPEVVIQRYKETRRRHPLLGRTDSLEEAVRQERVLMEPREGPGGCGDRHLSYQHRPAASEASARVWKRDGAGQHGGPGSFFWI